MKNGFPDYAHSFVGQEFRQGTVGMAHFWYTELEASAWMTWIPIDV